MEDYKISRQLKKKPKTRPTERLGMCDTKIYHVWRGIYCRCNDPNDKNYPRYGGRGITICKEWMDPRKFFAWSFLNGYTIDLTLDRIDNEKGYCPENCRWATEKQQQRNRRNNVIVEYNGEKHCISEWAEIAGISYSCLYGRLTAGWPMEKAMTVAPSYTNRKLNYGKWSH